MEFMNMVCFVLMILPYINGQLFGCELCQCDTSRKFARCFGSAILYWPPFPLFNNTMVSLSFTETSISDLPYIKPNEYKNLTSLYLFDNDNLECEEIIAFILENEHINVVYNTKCDTSTMTENMSTSYIPYQTTEGNDSKLVTEDNNDNSDRNDEEIFLLAIVILAVLGIGIGIGIMCIVFAVRYCIKKCKLKQENELDLSDIIFQMDTFANESEL